MLTIIKRCSSTLKKITSKSEGVLLKDIKTITVSAYVMSNRSESKQLQLQCIGGDILFSRIRFSKPLVFVKIGSDSVGNPIWYPETIHDGYLLFTNFSIEFEKLDGGRIRRGSEVVKYNFYFKKMKILNLLVLCILIIMGCDKFIKYLDHLDKIDK
jgi:hypothetical protein